MEPPSSEAISTQASRDPRLAHRNLERRPSQPSSGSDEFGRFIQQHSELVAAIIAATNDRDRAMRRLRVESEELEKAKQRQFRYPSVVSCVKHSKKRREETIARLSQKIDSLTKRRDEVSRMLGKSQYSGGDQQAQVMAAEISRLKDEVNKQSEIISTVDSHDKLIKQLSEQYRVFTEKVNNALESLQPLELAVQELQDKAKAFDRLQSVDNDKALVLAPAAPNSNNAAVVTDIKNLFDQLADLRKLEMEKDYIFGETLRRLEQNDKVCEAKFGRVAHDMVSLNNAIASFNPQALHHRLKDIYGHLTNHTNWMNGHRTAISTLQTQLPEAASLKVTSEDVEQLKKKMEAADARFEEILAQLKTANERSDKALTDLKTVDTRSNVVLPRLETVEARSENTLTELKTVGARFDKVLTELQTADAFSEVVRARLGTVDAQSDQVLTKLEIVDARFDKAFAKLNTLEQERVGDLAARVSPEEVQKLRADVSNTVERVDEVWQVTASKLAKVLYNSSQGEERLKALEQKVENILGSSQPPERAEPLTPSEEQSHMSIKSESHAKDIDRSQIRMNIPKKRKLGHSNPLQSPSPRNPN